MKLQYTPVNKAGLAMKMSTLETDKYESLQDIFKTVVSGVAWFKPKNDPKHATSITAMLGFDYLKTESFRRSPELHAAAQEFDGGKWVSKLTLNSDGRTERALSNTNVKLTLDIDGPDNTLEIDTEREIEKPDIELNTVKMLLTVTYTVPVRELTVVETVARVKKSDMQSFISSDPELYKAFQAHMETHVETTVENEVDA